MRQKLSFISTISKILEEIVQETDSLRNLQTTLFHAPKIPSITILNYLQRIAKYTNCSEQCYIISLIYIDRIQDKRQDIILDSHCIHRFILTSMMIAIKYQDDDYYKNEYYAKVGGITLKEVNQLEAEFLKLIDFELFIEESLFNGYVQKLLEIAE
ncbi:hypothetical protein pb186bvf_007973 [Paramecium bursaria]